MQLWDDLLQISAFRLRLRHYLKDIRAHYPVWHLWEVRYNHASCQHISFMQTTRQGAEQPAALYSNVTPKLWAQDEKCSPFSNVGPKNRRRPSGVGRDIAPQARLR